MGWVSVWLAIGKPSCAMARQSAGLAATLVPMGNQVALTRSASRIARSARTAAGE